MFFVFVLVSNANASLLNACVLTEAQPAPSECGRRRTDHGAHDHDYQSPIAFVATSSFSGAANGLDVHEGGSLQHVVVLDRLLDRLERSGGLLFEKTLDLAFGEIASRNCWMKGFLRYQSRLKMTPMPMRRITQLIVLALSLRTSCLLNFARDTLSSRARSS